MPPTPRHPLRLLLPAALIAIAPIVLMVMAYVGAEHPVYVWDFGAYWGYFKTYAHLVSTGAPDWLERLRQEVGALDYNPLAAALLYPAYLVAGDGRTAYVIGICVMYLLPATVIATLVALRAAPKANPLLLFVLALTYIPFWMPTLRGMVDIIGLIPLGLAALLVFRSDFLIRRTIPHALMLGVLVYLPFLMRRWYAYTIIVFLALTFLFGVYARVRRGAGVPRAVVFAALPLVLTGVVALTLLLVFQAELTRRILVTSYSELYAQFQWSFAEHFTIFPGALGYYLIGIIAVGAAVAVATRNLVAGFGLLAAVATFLFFIQTQFLATHHFLPIAFWLFPVYAAGIAWLADRLTMLPPWARMVPFAAAGTALFALSIVPGLDRGGRYVAPLVPEYAPFPLHLEHYDEYQRLVADLDTALGETGKVAAFSCSLGLSDELIGQLRPALAPHISQISCIPAVDLFNFENVRADYVLARSDELRHQEIAALASVMLAGERVRTGTGFGAAFEKVGSYTLNGGESAELFRRTRPVTEAETAELIDAFAKAYPGDVLAKYRKTMKLRFALRRAYPGDGPGQVRVTGLDSMFLHPGQATPTAIELPMDTRIGERPAAVVLSIPATALVTCPQADGIAATVTRGADTVWSGTVAAGSAERVALPAADGVLRIEADKRATPDCDHLSATFEFAP